jgi:hypothetical protein
VLDESKIIFKKKIKKNLSYIKLIFKKKSKKNLKMKMKGKKNLGAVDGSVLVEEKLV